MRLKLSMTTISTIKREYDKKLNTLFVLDWNNKFLISIHGLKRWESVHNLLTYRELVLFEIIQQNFYGGIAIKFGIDVVTNQLTIITIQKEYSSILPMLQHKFFYWQINQLINLPLGIFYKEDFKILKH